MSIPFMRALVAGDLGTAGSEIGAVVPEEFPEHMDHFLQFRLAQLDEDRTIRPWLGSVPCRPERPAEMAPPVKTAAPGDLHGDFASLPAMPRPISPARPPTAVIFDLGGVLIDWDPRHLYRGLFTDAAAMESFLAEVTTPAWNAEQDAGRPWAEAVAMLAERHPEQRDLIEAYHRRWSEMLAGAIEGTVAILQELRGSDVRLFALSNWSAETFPIARQRFPFLAWFDGIVISGDVGAVKPDARIFEHLVMTYGIEPADAVFIDDNASNVEAAQRLGFVALRFVDEGSLRDDLERLGLLA